MSAQRELEEFKARPFAVVPLWFRALLSLGLALGLMAVGGVGL